MLEGCGRLLQVIKLCCRMAMHCKRELEELLLEEEKYRWRQLRSVVLYCTSTTST